MLSIGFLRFAGFQAGLLFTRRRAIGPGGLTPGDRHAFFILLIELPRTSGRQFGGDFRRQGLGDVHLMLLT